MNTITIDPITRLEGHGKISIFLDTKGDVENAYLQIPELRGFERFSQGRRAEDMPQITSRICGVCPVAHHFAATKALDHAFHVDPPSAAKKLRELMYAGYYIYDHILHFYYLGGPDFVVGPDAPPAKRNVIGVIEKAGVEIGKEVIKHRAYGQKITAILGGKATHPVCGLPGGVSKSLSKDEIKEIETMTKSCVEFAKFSLKLFDDIVLKNKTYVDLILSDPYQLATYNMGLVDKNNKVNFYDGNVRVTDQKGKEIVKFDAKEYTKHISEHVEEWSYIKFPYLKKIGWKGFNDGKDSGIYRVGPLGRLNAAEGMATPLADKEYQKMFQTLGGKAVNSTLAFHWARLTELLYATERAMELIQDPEISSEKVRNPVGEPGEGVGVVEAARGTLFHHYKLDKKGLIEKANLIVATTNNAGAINMSVRNAAKGVISKGKVDNGILNMVEMAFRAYDPCFACATHTLPGGMPLEVNIYDSRKRLYKTFKRL
ncbi:MAG: Ni/Fe hydrogenase subunit alpha [Thermoplasmata archaeon M11B2D]|nr:MAG: Ni/Fe hydrogenase subunit alpha [Thermoplasmata archaeon M11B2D]PNX54191.1 MAG: Ni/Fe hydrogenase subunit alpha [Thermoplasmata archaeon M9B2D]